MISRSFQESFEMIYIFFSNFTQQGFKNSRTEFHLKYLVINNIRGVLGDDFTFDTSKYML